MSGPDFAGVLAGHRTLANGPSDCVCACDRTWRKTADYRAHLSAALHAEVARWLAEDVVATLREMSAKQFDRTGPHNARGAAIWDVAGWLETTAALTTTGLTITHKGADQ